MKEVAFLLLMSILQDGSTVNPVPLKVYETADQCINAAGQIYLQSLQKGSKRWEELDFPEMKYFCAVVPADYKN
jgi:hypothetical protein